MDKYYYGAHFSISKGIYKTIDEALDYGCNMLQIFVSNPMGRSKNDDKLNYYIEESLKIKKYIEERDIKIVIHAPYILNFAKIPEFGKNESWWLKTLWKELTISNYIHSIGVVIHVGKYLDLTIEDGKNNMYKSLKYIIEKMIEKKYKTKIILETAAGQGTELLVTKNNDISEFAEFYNRFSKKEKKYIRLCVDTCHIFAAGYDIRKREQVNNFFKEFDEKIGIEYLALIHLNDSKTEYGKCVDRHENIGIGKIGLNGLKNVIKIAVMNKIPTILETPESSIEEIEMIKKIKNKIDKIKY